MYRAYARNQYEWDNMHPDSFYDDDDEAEDDEEMKIQLAEDAREMEAEAEFEYLAERC